MYGYELVEEAVVDARRNAARNGIENATFIQGDLNKLTDEFGKEFPRPDIVITGSYIPSFRSSDNYIFSFIFYGRHLICFFFFFVTDPNRPGMHMKLIKYLLQLQARRIVYISCNPATCARDLDLLCHTEANVSDKVEAHVYLII